MTPTNVQRLETIAIKLENIPKEKRNPITADMEWLVEKLRAAWLEIEAAQTRASQLVDAGDYYSRAELLAALQQIADGEMK